MSAYLISCNDETGRSGSGGGGGGSILLEDVGSSRSLFLSVYLINCTGGAGRSDQE